MKALESTTKRARDTAPEEAPPSAKWPKTTGKPPSLNCTQDRDTAILNLCEAVNDVSP